ncbi:uncharacterized protein Z519_05038 [Cladophialophora bantiana CBS 173.52]|uniref:Uncharacterized protein n=1 Tax=Cladophialophora bantiana (strain ATCC 10958 / CBS 173.52 / CDC B-1940 / NIH 8579) TaxID=1442370 RepID=A0A0D2IAA3_CLAB1|nr:uncharacterized protein Z519_05038 [Cladophialophora bantiana CBS 173.52]KIW93724.1 hypothetical protein Z519_05038 [Cladophialophora bantiana CBS 173.52]
MYILSEIVGFESSDPRDRVYALIGMMLEQVNIKHQGFTTVIASDEQTYPVDYQKNTEVYQDVTHHLTRNSQSLLPLHIFRSYTQKKGDLPGCLTVTGVTIARVGERMLKEQWGDLADHKTPKWRVELGFLASGTGDLPDRLATSGSNKARFMRFIQCISYSASKIDFALPTNYEGGVQSYNKEMGRGIFRPKLKMTTQLCNFEGSTATIDIGNPNSQPRYRKRYTFVGPAVLLQTPVPDPGLKDLDFDQVIELPADSDAIFTDGLKSEEFCLT